MFAPSGTGLEYAILVPGRWRSSLVQTKIHQSSESPLWERKGFVISEEIGREETTSSLRGIDVNWGEV